MIKVIYNKVCGRCVQSEPLTSGMVGQPIHFEYSHDFDGLAVTAVFTDGKNTVDVVNPGNECVIPHEVLDTVGTLVKVGIYAVRGNELVIPTVYAHIGIVLKGADPSGDVSIDPTLPVWAQTQALIGNLSELETQAKDSLVAAINEVKQTTDTKQDKLIAGDNITIAADGKTISATGGGGSSDAVLYTSQTLTDAQKKQARDNIDAAIADFVVNGTINQGGTVTLDKTFAQIQAAIQEGKHPVVHITGMGDTLLPLVNYDTDYVAFAAVGDVSEGSITSIGIMITADAILFNHSVSPVFNSEGDLIQYPMATDPISPMQIATKHYVDNKECILKSTTPGSTKKFKITVDDSGTLSATEVTA